MVTFEEEVQALVREVAELAEPARHNVHHLAELTPGQLTALLAQKPDDRFLNLARKLQLVRLLEKELNR